MATQGSDLSTTRMSAEDQRLIREMALKLFKEHKIEISHAINTTFPFFEKLRDLGLITHEKYKESIKSCENLSPVPKVVYDILNELDEKSHLSVLEILFSKVFMKHYPDLEGICKSFRDVIQKEICYQANDEEKGAKIHDTRLSLEQGTGENSCPSMLWLFLDQSNYTGEELPNYEIPVNSGPVFPVDREKTMLVFNSGGECETQARTDCNQACDVRVTSSEDSAEHRNREESPEASASAVTKEPGTADLGETSTTQKVKKKRWSKKHEEEFVDFHCKILPVTCGHLKGMLHMDKLGKRSRVKCIETEDGNWFTPSEFSVKGGYQKSSFWKSTVRCGGKTIKKLMEEGKFATWPKEQDKETEVLPIQPPQPPPQTSPCPAKVNFTKDLDIISDSKNMGHDSPKLAKEVTKTAENFRSLSIEEKGFGYKHS